MKLVLLFFCGILIFIMVLIVLILFSKIKLNIEKYNITNIKGNMRKKGLDKEIRIYLEFYLLGIIKIAKIKITKELLQKMKINKDIKAIEKDIKVVKSVHPLDIIKKLKIEVEKLNFYLAFGTESVMLTVNLVAIISSIIGITFRETNHKKVRFQVIPLYNFGNAIKFNLNCIINVKVVHIIYVIYILLRKRRSKDERTSNRGSYDYSYE